MDVKPRITDESMDKSKIWKLTEINEPAQCRSLRLIDNMRPSKVKLFHIYGILNPIFGCSYFRSHPLQNSYGCLSKRIMWRGTFSNSYIFIPSGKVFHRIIYMLFQQNFSEVKHSSMHSRHSIYHNLEPTNVVAAAGQVKHVLN